MVAVMVVVVGITDIPSKDVNWISLGYLAAAALLTVTATAWVVKEFPALSAAVAVKLWEPLLKVVVFKEEVMLPEVVVAKTVPST